MQQRIGLDVQRRGAITAILDVFLDHQVLGRFRVAVSRFIGLLIIGRFGGLQRIGYALFRVGFGVFGIILAQVHYFGGRRGFIRAGSAAAHSAGCEVDANNTNG